MKLLKPRNVKGHVNYWVYLDAVWFGSIFEWGQKTEPIGYCSMGCQHIQDIVVLSSFQLF